MAPQSQPPPTSLLVDPHPETLSPTPTNGPPDTSRFAANTPRLTTIVSTNVAGLVQSGIAQIAPIAGGASATNFIVAPEVISTTGVPRTSSSTTAPTASSTASSSSSSTSQSTGSSSSTDSAAAAASTSAGASSSSSSSGPSPTVFIAIFVPLFVILLVASVLFWLWRIRRTKRINSLSEEAAAKEKSYQMTAVTPNSDSSTGGSPPMKSAVLPTAKAPPRPSKDAPPLTRHLRAPSKQNPAVKTDPTSGFSFPWSRNEREKRASKNLLGERNNDALPPTLPALGFGEAVAHRTDSTYSGWGDRLPPNPGHTSVTGQPNHHYSTITSNTEAGSRYSEGPQSRYSEGPGPSMVGSVSPPNAGGFSTRTTQDMTPLMGRPDARTSNSYQRSQAPSRGLYGSPFGDRAGSSMAGGIGDEYEDDVSDIEDTDKRKSRKDADNNSIVSDLSEPGESAHNVGSRAGTGMGTYSRQGQYSRQDYR